MMVFGQISPNSFVSLRDMVSYSLDGHPSNADVGQPGQKGSENGPVRSIT